mmetsp:Transcript_28201/g.63813  ORF Transcript_28201/g.63813 Transcript_28201/m.63813 type:complete len:247 (+) Transcript_28201:1837-2577(+)
MFSVWIARSLYLSCPALDFTSSRYLAFTSFTASSWGSSSATQLEGISNRKKVSVSDRKIVPSFSRSAGFGGSSEASRTLASFFSSTIGWLPLSSNSSRAGTSSCSSLTGVDVPWLLQPDRLNPAEDMLSMSNLSELCWLPGPERFPEGTCCIGEASASSRLAGVTSAPVSGSRTIRLCVLSPTWLADIPDLLELMPVCRVLLCFARDALDARFDEEDMEEEETPFSPPFTPFDFLDIVEDIFCRVR